MSNLDLWNKAFQTDPSAVKPITGKQYKGNSPKPYWIVQRATELLGACGIGWGLIVVSERFERLTPTDVLHVALVRVWYIYDGKRGEIEQMGQTKACYETSSGKMMVDEDAPKKSITDGMVKCLSMIGFAGDIFSGRWDDSKYQDELKAEFSPTKQQNNPAEKEADAMFEAALSAIKAAPDVETLKNHFIAAKSLCSNTLELKSVETAKDKRKKELGV